MLFTKTKILVTFALLAFVAAFVFFDLSHYLSFEYIKEQQTLFENYYQKNQWLTMGAYFVVYILVTSLSLPGAAVLTILGGALFGLLKGTLLVSFASTFGATFAFLISRILLRDSIERKFGDRLKAFNQGLEKDGLFYLFTLRLIPALPFFVVNLAAGLTSLKTLHYALISQLGMLPGTLVYVNAGTELSKLNSLTGILSLPLILSFVLLGTFPLIIKFIIKRVNQKGKKHGPI